MSVVTRILIVAGLVCVAAAPLFSATSTPYKILQNARNIIVWQEFDPWLMITEDLAAGRTCYYYNPKNKSKLTLKEPLPGTWIPLGSAIKWLMYVDHYQNLDRLMAHDVDWHFYYIAWPSATNQVGAGMRDVKCVFGQYRANPVGDHYPVDLYAFNVQTGACPLFCASDSEKSQFAHDGNLIVYRAYGGPGSVRIMGIYFDGATEFEIAPRDGIHPSVCGSLVAWAERSGAGYNVLAKDISTGEMRTIVYTTADPPLPEAGRRAIFWQDRRNGNLDIYGYDWDTQQQFVVTNAAGDQSRLRVCDDLVTWVTGATNYQTLWGADITPPVRVVDLRANRVTANSVTLAWTSVGSTQNPPTAYDLRMRRDGPVSDVNWSTSTQVTGLPAPLPAGQRETHALQQLAPGLIYFAMKVHLADGTWTPLSNGVSSYLSSAIEALAAPDGAFISFTGIITGSAASITVYCQSVETVDAVRAGVATGETVPPIGASVVLTGIIGQDTELCGPVLAQSVVEQLGAAPVPTCLAMSNRSLGGIDPRFGAPTGAGPSNVWMLVKSWGRVSDVVTTAGCSFYMTDGSKITDNAGKGVYVTSPFAPPTGLANGSYVTVEGISRLSRTTGRQIEVISSAGIRVAQP